MLEQNAKFEDNEYGNGMITRYTDVCLNSGGNGRLVD